MNLLGGLISLVILLFSAILHEVAHGFVAERLGDPTARLAGRLTLNPKKHIDLYMSILLPLLLIISGSPIIFGAAKPVPVDPFNLKEGKKDLALVSLSGPLTNIVIAILTSVVFRIFFSDHSVLEVIYGRVMLDSLPNLLLTILGVTIYLNLILAIFNLIPIPPLDGSKVFAMLLSNKQAQAYLSISSIGIFIIFFLLLFPIGGFSLMHLVSSIVFFTLTLLGV